jgi:hypothetical protein
MTTATALGLSLASLRPTELYAQAMEIPIGTGLHSYNGVIVLKMQEMNLLERAGSELGLRLNATYQDYQVLLRMLQALAAGQLQFGQLGTTPTIRSLTRPRPAIPIALCGGGINFRLVVAPNSPIRTFQQLRGKTILTVAGSDIHLVLLNALKAAFGTDDLRELGITLRSMQATTELTSPQPGVDAIWGFDPNGLDAQLAGRLVTLVDNFGKTGPHYDGPEGRGEGHTLAFFRQARYAPEAFYPHRQWWVVREQFLEQNPNAVIAILVAQHRATQLLARMPVAEVVDTVIKDHWPATREAKIATMQTCLWMRRGWNWITEGDAETLVGMSRVRALFDQELVADALKRLLRQTAEVAKRAYDICGGDPAPAVFTDANAGDVRGLPHWEIDRWTRMS